MALHALKLTMVAHLFMWSICHGATAALRAPNDDDDGVEYDVVPKPAAGTAARFKTDRAANAASITAAPKAEVKLGKIGAGLLGQPVGTKVMMPLSEATALSTKTVSMEKEVIAAANKAAADAKAKADASKNAADIKAAADTAAAAKAAADKAAADDAKAKADASKNAADIKTAADAQATAAAAAAAAAAAKVAADKAAADTNSADQGLAQLKPPAIVLAKAASTPDAKAASTPDAPKGASCKELGYAKEHYGTCCAHHHASEDSSREDKAQTLLCVSAHERAVGDSSVPLHEVNALGEPLDEAVGLKKV